MTMRVKKRKTGSKSATNWLSASVSGFEVMKKLTIIDRSIQYHSSESMSGQTQQCSTVLFLAVQDATLYSEDKIDKKILSTSRPGQLGS